MLHVLYGFAVRIHVASRKAGQKKKKKMLKKKSMFIQHACFVSDSSTNSVFALAEENALNNYLIRVVSLISMQNANVLHGNAYACTPKRTHYLAEELRFYQSHSICSLHRAHILDIDIDWEKIFVVKFRCKRTLVRQRTCKNVQCTSHVRQRFESVIPMKLKPIRVGCVFSSIYRELCDQQIRQHRKMERKHVISFIFRRARENRQKSKRNLCSLVSSSLFLFSHFIVELGSSAGQSVESCCNMSKYV